jgi:hypothetical protein
MKELSDRGILIPSDNGDAKEYLKVCQFQTIHFYDKTAEREVILLYALTVDGIIREFNGGRWTGLPVLTDPK